MTDPVADLRRAEVTAAEARRRLDTTVAETRRRVDATVADLQVRLHPRALAHDARQAGSAVALAGIDSAQRNPRVVAGVAAAAALLFIRGRIAALRRRRRARKPVPAAPRTSPSRPEDAS